MLSLTQAKSLWRTIKSVNNNIKYTERELRDLYNQLSSQGYNHKEIVKELILTIYIL